MTDDEPQQAGAHAQNVDDGSRNLAHMLKLMTELRSVMDERPDHALLLVQEVYATYDSLPAELRQDARREVPAHDCVSSADPQQVATFKHATIRERMAVIHGRAAISPFRAHVFAALMRPIEGQAAARVRAASIRTWLFGGMFSHDNSANDSEGEQGHRYNPKIPHHGVLLWGNRTARAGGRQAEDRRSI